MVLHLQTIIDNSAAISSWCMTVFVIQEQFCYYSVQETFIIKVAAIQWERESIVEPQGQCGMWQLYN